MHRVTTSDEGGGLDEQATPLTTELTTPLFPLPLLLLLPSSLSAVPSPRQQPGLRFRVNMLHVEEGNTFQSNSCQVARIPSMLIMVQIPVTVMQYQGI